jgi:sigma-B regulation protein RsbU (phosphoserine phosphatase)
MLQMGDLATLMRHVNRLVYEASATNRYATFFYAEYAPSTRLLTYVNAGHNAPVILRSGQAIPLDANGTVVGLLPDADYEQATIPLHPGDALLAFTDGISEAMTAEEEEWGEARMIDCILQAADTFTRGAPQTRGYDHTRRHLRLNKSHCHQFRS